MGVTEGEVVVPWKRGFCLSRQEGLCGNGALVNLKMPYRSYVYLIANVLRYSCRNHERNQAINGSLR